jgi:hypothetical protein
MSKNRIVIILFLGILIWGWAAAEAAPGDTTADAVLGQANVTSNAPNNGGSVSPTGFDWPYGMAVDNQNGRLYLADY